MELSRQEYPALLTGTEPEQAVEILNSRVATINKIHSDIADWLAERRRIEEQYATALRKLARRPQQDNASALGVFQTPWQRIVSSVEDLAQSHETLAAKIQADVETPLRQFGTTNRELTSMGNMSGNLSVLAKDLSNARKKAQKLDAKDSDKAEGAKSKVDDASSQWDSQAPFVFEQLQAADEARVNHLRDVLTQFKTHEIDQIEKSRAGAESCLNVLLNVETADEIATFARKAKQQAGTTSSRRDSLIAAARPSAGMPPAPPPPRNTSLGDRNGSTSQQQDTLAPLPDTPKEKKLSGLKRLGTVMGRRKNAAPPPPPSEKKKDNRKSFMPFKRSESSRSFQDLESSGRDLSPVVSHERPSTRPDSERPPQTQESRLSEAEPSPALNGANAVRSTTQDSASFPQAGALQPALVPEATDVPTLPQPRPTSNFDPSAQATQSPSAEEPARAFEIKDKPIAEDAGAAQEAMDNMANQLRLQAQTSGLNRGQGTVRGRRDVRNTMFIPNPPQQELPSAAVAAAIVASPSFDGSYRATEPSATSPTSTATLTPATPAMTDKALPIRSDTVDSVTSDAQSMHSSYSAAAIGPHHQETTVPGLNASIVETVNTWLSDDGITKSFVIGEVALAYNRTAAGNPEKELVRIQNFHQLEKCAQNPQFIQPSDAGEDQPGTYHVNVPSIARSIPTVAFKYQLHINENNLSIYSPILVTQAWQLVQGQASIILLYSLNPAFAQIANPGSSSAVNEITLKNVSISITLDKEGPRAVSAQMMPVQNAHYKKRTGAVAWRFPELVVRQTQERLLVRFMIENNGTAKRGGVDLKFEAPGMLASALGLERLGHAGSDPFADEDEPMSPESTSSGGRHWEDVQARKTLVSGKYTAT